MARKHSFLTVATFVLLCLGMSGAKGPEHDPDRPGWWRYTTYAGFFEQDDPATNPARFKYMERNFGLITQTYETDSVFDPDRKRTQWERFENKVNILNAESGPDVQYKVLFVGRHGEGWHNVAGAKYGEALWDCKYSLLTGLDGIVWDDAVLTPLGVNQTVAVKDFYEKQLKHAKMPAPQRYYVSPLKRTLMTSFNEFSKLDLPKDRPFRPIVKERLRETLGIQTCNRRHSETSIKEGWPTAILEPDFTEQDELWKPDIQESASQQTYRLKQHLDDIFDTDPSTFISFTTHGGSIMALLRATGHVDFPLDTSGQIPLFVKAEWVRSPEPRPRLDPGRPVPKCP